MTPIEISPEVRAAFDAASERVQREFLARVRARCIVFGAMLRAVNDPERLSYWTRHKERLESWERTRP